LAVADVVAARGRNWVIGYLVASSAVLAVFARLVVIEFWVP
jgi:hypothetical protein